MLKKAIMTLTTFSAAWSAENVGLVEVNNLLKKCDTTSFEIINETGMLVDFDVTYKSSIVISPNQTINITCLPGTDGFVDSQGTIPAKEKMKIINFQSKELTTALYHLGHVTAAAQQQDLYIAPGELYFHKLTVKGIDQPQIYIKEINSGNLVINIASQPAGTLSGLFVTENIATKAQSTRKRSAESRAFLKTVLPSLQITHRDFYAKLDCCYNSNFQYLKSPSLGQELRIPKIIHSIWVTNPLSPKEPNQKAADYLYQTMLACPPSDGYRYIFWVNDPASLPNLCSHPLNYRDVNLEKQIEFKTITELGLISPFDQHYEYAMKTNNFGMASDILRCVILATLGGIYRDDDYQILHNLDPLLRSCDFVSGIEAPELCFVGNAFVAAKANHPILEQCKTSIAQNLNPNDKPNYLKDMSPIMHTLFATGPFMLSTAIYKKANQDGNIDIILPGDYLFPAIQTMDGVKKTPHLSTMLGIHFQAKSWVTDVGSSVGSL